MSLAKSKIVVVGSLHHDIVVEAARQPVRGETLMGEIWYPKFGGKGGNQAVAARRAGVEVEMVGAVGDDLFGQHLREILAAEAVGDAHVETLGTGTGMSVAIVDIEGDYAAVVVTGANAQIDVARVQDPALFAEAAVLILQNELPQSVNLAAAKAAVLAGVRVIWNAAPMRPDELGLTAHTDILILNAIEAQALTAIAIKTLDDAARAAEVASELGPAVIVTAGALGFATAQPGNKAQTTSAKPVEHARAHGAGDVFTGCLAAGIVQGLTLADAAAQAGDAAHRHVSGLS